MSESLQHQHDEDMDFLRRAAMALVEFPRDGDLFDFVAQRLQELVGPEYIVAVAEKEGGEFVPRHILGLRVPVDRLVQLLGAHPEDLRGDSLTEVIEAVPSGRLFEVPGGAARITGGALPMSLVKPVLSLFGTRDAWAIGFSREGTVFGAVVLVARTGAPPPRAGVVEALVGLVAVALERQRAERDREVLEAQLLQAQKMEAVGRLAGGVAHDFNNLLTAILGNASMALYDTRPEDPIRANLEEVERASQRAAVLVRQLLAFSRRQVISPRPVDVAELLEGMRRMLTRLLDERFELRLSIDPALPSVRVDPGQLEQVLLNLVVNARDAMPEGGVVEVRAGVVEEEGESLVRIAVADEGCGMSEAVQERIFEPFFTTKAVGEGTGLGLSMVYGAVMQNGGRIEVDSAPGEGATFEIHLPALDQTGEIDPGFLRQTLPRGTETVLVVEDEDAVRTLACQVLRRQGYRVLEARNGGEATFVLERHEGPLHLLLTDVVMPLMQGDELAERVLAARPGVRALFTSGYSQRTMEFSGEASFIAKPFTPLALAEKVRRVLDA